MPPANFKLPSYPWLQKLMSLLLYLCQMTSDEDIIHQATLFLYFASVDAFCSLDLSLLLLRIQTCIENPNSYNFWH